MKFGKLENVDAVDFSLPQEPSNNINHLSGSPAKAPTLYVGCTGWTMPDWKGTFYPEKTRVKDFLSAYSKQFNTIEFNTTHYNIPKVETVKRWKAESTDDFIFCPKVFKYISHTKDLGVSRDGVNRMLDSLIHLEEKLGPFFMQLPPYYGLDRKEQLLEFVDNWPREIPIAVELRNASWYESETELDQLQDEVATLGQSLLITDVSGRRDIVHMRICQDILLVRWVGNSLHPTDYARIDEWIDRIIYYVNHGLEKIYFFAHEPDNLLAPDIAMYICEQVTKKIDLTTRGPQRITSGSQLKLL